MNLLPLSGDHALRRSPAVPAAAVLVCGLLCGALAALRPHPQLLVVPVLVLAAGVLIWAGLRLVDGRPAAWLGVLVVLVVLTGSVLQPAIELRRTYLVMYNLAAGVLVFASCAVVTIHPLYTWREHGSWVPIALWSLTGLAALGVGIGLVHQNDVDYLVGDTYKMLMIPAYLVLFGFAGPRLSNRARSTLIFLLVMSLVAGQGIAVSQWLMRVSDGVVERLWTVGPWSYNLVAFVGLLTLTRRAPWPVAGSALCLVFVVIAGLLTGYRVLLVSYAIALAAVWWLRSSTEVRLLGAGVALGLAVVIGAALISAGPQLAESLAATPFLYRWAPLLVNPLGDSSLSGRLQEVLTVTNILEADPVALVFGKGSGAVYPLAAEASEYATRLYANRDLLVHNVHIFFVGVLFRHGMIGVLVWTFILVSLARAALARVSRASGPPDFRRQGVFIAVLVLCFLVLAVQISIVDRDYSLWISVGLTGLVGSQNPAAEG